jgi:predicted transcriptional regulator
MDAQKDISISLTEKNLDATLYSQKSESFIFLHKKTEKLSAALYLVTNLFPETEPMKKTLREKALNLIKDVDRDEVLHVISLLSIACRSGLLGQTNFSILKQEFSSLLNYLDEENQFGRSFFEIPKIREESKEIIIKDKNEDIKDNGFRKSDRRNIILSLLKKEGELSIKDIAGVIKNCSEKTIQRELVYFIEKGLVKRKGERRWAKYSLIDF